MEFGLQLITHPEAWCKYQGTPHSFAFVRKQRDDGSLASTVGILTSAAAGTLLPTSCPA